MCARPVRCVAAVGEQRGFHLGATCRGEESLREHFTVIGADVRGQQDARDVIVSQQRDAENRRVRHDCGAIRDVTPWRRIRYALLSGAREHVDLGGVVDARPFRRRRDPRQVISSSPRASCAPGNPSSASPPMAPASSAERARSYLNGASWVGDCTPRPA